MYCNKNVSRSVIITGMNENNFRCFFQNFKRVHSDGLPFKINLQPELGPQLVV